MTTSFLVSLVYPISLVLVASCLSLQQTGSSVGGEIHFPASSRLVTDACGLSEKNGIWAVHDCENYLRARVLPRLVIVCFCWWCLLTSVAPHSVGKACPPSCSTAARARRQELSSVSSSPKGTACPTARWYMRSVSGGSLELRTGGRWTEEVPFFNIDVIQWEWEIRIISISVKWWICVFLFCYCLWLLEWFFCAYIWLDFFFPSYLIEVASSFVFIILRITLNSPPGQIKLFKPP